MRRFDPESCEGTVCLDYLPRDWVRIRFRGSVGEVGVVDGDGSMSTRFEVGFVFGKGRDEADVGRAELGDDPSVWILRFIDAWCVRGGTRRRVS